MTPVTANLHPAVSAGAALPRVSAPVAAAPFGLWAGAGLGSDLALVKVEWSGAELLLVPSACRFFSLAGERAEDLIELWEQILEFAEGMDGGPLWYRRNQTSGPQAAAAAAVRLETMALLAAVLSTTVHTLKVAHWCRKNPRLIPPPQDGLTSRPSRVQGRAVEMAAYAVHAWLNHSEAGDD